MLLEGPKVSNVQGLKWTWTKKFPQVSPKPFSSFLRSVGKTTDRKWARIGISGLGSEEGGTSHVEWRWEAVQSKERTFSGV